MATKNLSRERVLILGGTGSLGKALTRRLLAQRFPPRICIFSRDEAKHHKHRAKFNSHNVSYFIGDVRDYNAIVDCLNFFQPDLIINAAAMKQVPACEDQPTEAVMTNVIGSANLSRAVSRHKFDLSERFPAFLSVSTDKAVKSVNAYGATKALQEKIHLATKTEATVSVVRYGNVLESTGSVIPVFKKLLEQDKPIMVTDERMTRFLLSLDDAVDLIFIAADANKNKNIYVPRCQSARILDLAHVMCEAYGKDPEQYVQLGKIRPGEKLDEILVSEEETSRLDYDWNYKHFLVTPYEKEVSYSENLFSSGAGSNLLGRKALQRFLASKGVIECTSSESQVAADSLAEI